MQARWKTITGWVIAAAVAVAVFLAIHGSRSEPVPPPRRPVSKSPQISAPKPGRPAELARTTVPPDTAATKPQFEVCVDGRPRTVTLTDPGDVSQYVFEMKPETYDRWKSALIGGADARARAVGLALQRFDDISAGSLAADTSVEQLVDLATTARDPVAYGVAVGVCKTGITEDVAPACRRLTLSEWSKLDPDNAVPWLAAAATARNNGDSWAESVAFARAAQAHKVDDYGKSSLSAALAVLPADTSRPERLAGQIRLIGYEAARARPDIMETSRYCSAAPLQQSKIHDQCDAVAELLVDQGESLLNFSLGRSIGQRVGWPAARLDQMAQERDALRGLVNSSGGNGMLSCDAMAWQDDFLKRRGEVGELAALRELRDKRAQGGQLSN